MFLVLCSRFFTVTYMRQRFVECLLWDIFIWFCCRLHTLWNTWSATSATPHTFLLQNKTSKAIHSVNQLKCKSNVAFSFLFQTKYIPHVRKFTESRCCLTQQGPYWCFFLWKLNFLWPLIFLGSNLFFRLSWVLTEAADIFSRDLANTALVHKGDGKAVKQ